MDATHNEFKTSAFVSIPFDNADKEWSIFLDLPTKIVEQFMKEQASIRFKVCNSGGMKGKATYIALGREDKA